MRSYPVKENPIGLAVSEILSYKQTNRQTNKQTDIVLLCIIDNLYGFYQKPTSPFIANLAYIQ